MVPCTAPFGPDSRFFHRNNTTEQIRMRRKCTDRPNRNGDDQRRHPEQSATLLKADLPGRACGNYHSIFKQAL